LVQDGVYDAFTKRLAETAGAMKVADGFEPGAVIGPLIDMKAVEKVEAHIADALKKGAKVVTGGKRAAGRQFLRADGADDVTTDMVITQEETFGPVAPLYRFKSEDEAVKMANDTEFGLAAIAPFGGMKESGIGPICGSRGSKYGIEEFLEVKYLCMGGIDR
jgi:succinate-semialdehyde dehydrogenase / glutarate-semialdehyde dehydrogenase